MTPIPHVWQPREINARLVRAACSCGWGARSARTSVVRAIADHDRHVRAEETRVSKAALA
jgi:hypothetical protein